MKLLHFYCMKKRFFILNFFFLFLILNAFTVYAVVEYSSMPIFAVTDTDEALRADLDLNLIPGGTADSFFSSKSVNVGTSTQTTGRIAVALAENYSDDSKKYDYKFNIKTQAVEVDGPSAGAAMALLVISSLQDKSLPGNVAVTGTITPDGIVGPVGGVFFKVQESSKHGIDLFMIPRGEGIQTVKLDGKIQTVDLIQHAFDEWNLKVVEVRTIDDVLKLAFENVEKIDITEQSSEREPIFKPKEIQINGKLNVMKDVFFEILEKSEQSLEESKQALNQTTIDDHYALSILLEYQRFAERNYEESSLLFDQNYLYSSANTAYLSLVYSSLVKDIAQNPVLLELDSDFFNQKLTDLSDKIDEFENSFSERLPVDLLEWNISSKQRLLWAKNFVQNLLTVKTVVLDNNERQKINIAVSNVESFHFAKEWLNVSKQFYEISKKSNSFAVQGEEFSDFADVLISEAENAVSSVDIEESEDVTRRLNSSRIAREKGWNVSSATDAFSAIALNNSRIRSQNQSLEQLVTFLEEKITDLEQRMSESGRDFLWPQLYLDHAKYFLEASAFYESEGLNTSAIDRAKSGLSLVFLAEGVFEVTDEAYNFYENVPVQNLSIPPVEDDTIFIFLIIIAGTLVFGIILKLLHSKQDKKIENISSLIRKRELLHKKELKIKKQERLIERKIRKAKDKPKPKKFAFKPKKAKKGKKEDYDMY